MSVHFLRVELLWLLLPLALGVVLLLRQRQRTGRWHALLDPGLAPFLVEGHDRPRGRGLTAAFALGWLLGVVALAGPSFERQPQPVGQGDDALILVLDLSLSMYAEDLPPSRLVRARLKIEDVLAGRGDGRTALVVYAGDAHTVIPLTDDGRTILNLLPALEPSIMPVLGSRLGPALALASDLLDAAPASDGRILLLTDGLADERPEEVARASRYPVFILGVGTADGAPIPLEPLGRRGVLEEGGRPVRARLDSASLGRLARATGGSYASFDAGGADLAALGAAEQALSDVEAKDSAFELWVDAGPWLVYPLLLLALLAFQRGRLAGLVLAAGLLSTLPSGPTLAADAPWYLNADQAGVRALRRGEPDAALGTLEDPRWRATALYRNKEFDAAASAFAAFDDVAGHYNRGNALAKGGHYEAALEAYDVALARAPEFEEAARNRALVAELLEKAKAAAQNEQGKQKDQPEAGDSDAEAGNNGQEQGQDAPPEEPGDSGEGDEAQPGDDATDGAQEDTPAAAETPGEQTAQAAQAEEEAEQALEQWLRRVPDEPGALLKRKFRYETERRYRQGLPRASETEQAW
jgi:Ca-activated chloride channel family protein